MYALFPYRQRKYHAGKFKAVLGEDGELDASYNRPLPQANLPHFHS